MDLSMQHRMREAMRLMRSGDLRAATAVLQQPAAPDQAAFRNRPAAGTPADWLDGEFRVIRPEAAGTADATYEPNVASPDRTVMPADGHAPSQMPFEQRSFRCAAGGRDYKLYVPASYCGEPLPLLVMLHGCTQSPDDFARGTRMNLLAEKHGFVVAYPGQGKPHNTSKCWNWFRPEDQQREHGEPAILAGLTRAVMRELRIDAHRVYVAGLSAGGAMATVLGRVHTDLYAAIGVHSGLPYGSAYDVPSAFAAMRRQPGQPGRRPRETVRDDATETVPAIVFHGDRDHTVHPDNGEQVIAQSLAPSAISDAHAETEIGNAVRGRRYTRTVFRSADGMSLAERWIIHGAGHAWSGGDPAGTYVDPNGPDASAEMVRFFLAHPRRRSE